MLLMAVKLTHVTLDLFHVLLELRPHHIIPEVGLGCCSLPLSDHHRGALDSRP